MTGVRVEGLDKLQQGLRRANQRVNQEVGEANREVGRLLTRFTSQRRSQMANRFPSYRIADIDVSADQKQVEVGVGPAAAELGARLHPVFGRFMPQSEFRRRVWPERSQKGWLVRPTVDQRRRPIDDTYLKAVTDLIRKSIK